MMDKQINVSIKYISDKYLLVFGLAEEKIIDLYSDNQDQMKELFSQIFKDLLDNDIEFLLSIDDSVEKKDSLPVNVAKEYIKTLNADLKKLKHNQNLTNVRNLYRVRA